MSRIVKCRICGKTMYYQENDMENGDVYQDCKNVAQNNSSQTYNK